MALSNQAYLDQLRTARDAVTDAILAGEVMVSYTVRGRTYTQKAGSDVLKDLEEMIQVYERKANAGSGKRWRVGTLVPPGGRG